MAKIIKSVDRAGLWKPGESGNPSTQWKPGVSPNPGGRPKKTPIADALRDLLEKPYDGKIAKYKGMTNATAIAIKLFDLVIETGDMQAAKEIADRVEGKTVQIQQLQGPGGGAIPFTDVSPQENERRIEELMSKAGGITDGNSAD